MAEKQALILVTNDDGITAPGLRTLIKVMNTIGEVIVVAPDRRICRSSSRKRDI